MNNDFQQHPNGSTPPPSMGKGRLAVIRHFLSHQLWLIDTSKRGRFARMGITLLRLLVMLIKRANSDNIATRAYALTAVTVLSLVPLLAVILVAARAVGMWQWLKATTIEPTIAELGHMQDFAQQVLAYVENTRFASLGIVGIALLFYTSISLLSQIEKSFNHVWGVKSMRNPVRRLTDYTSILIFSPLFIAAAAYFQILSSSYMSQLIPELWSSGGIGNFFSKLASYVLMWLGFSFLFLVMPHRRIPILPAVGAGIVTGTVYRLTLWIYVAGQVGVAKYSALYAGLAALPLTVVWLYFSWLITLIGCELAYALHHFTTYAQEQDQKSWSRAATELLALRVLFEAVYRFEKQLPPPTVDQMATRWGLPDSGLSSIVSSLVDAGLVRETSDGGGLLPASPPEHLTVGEARSRLAHLGTAPKPQQDPHWLLMKEALSKSREGVTLDDLLEEVLTRSAESPPTT